MSIVRYFALAAALACLVCVGSVAHAALITFSALTGATTAPITGIYQPLLNAYPVVNGNVDGANIGVTITWSGIDVATAVDNDTVNDHTHQVSTDSTNINALVFPSTTATITFSSPVTVPSFWFSYNPASGAVPATLFSSYTNSSDLVPSDTISASNPGGNPTVWEEVTGFGTSSLEKITISNVTLGSYLGIDDITVNAVVPEPATLALLLSGGLVSLVCLSRRSRMRVQSFLYR